MNLTLASSNFAPIAAARTLDSASAFATIVPADQSLPTKGSVGDIARADVIYAGNGEASELGGDTVQILKGGLAVNPAANEFPSDDGSGNVGPRAISQDIRSGNAFSELYGSDAAASTSLLGLSGGAGASHVSDVIANAIQAHPSPATSEISVKLSPSYTSVLHGNGKSSFSHFLPGYTQVTPFSNSDNAAASAFIGADASIKAKPFSPEFPSQGAAADYISSQMVNGSSYAPADEKMRDAVNEACREWKPGMDLAQMVYDKVRSALTGVLPEYPSQSGSSPQFDSVGTADSVARIAEAQIRANGNTVGGVAEHMLFTPIEHP